MQWNRKPSAWRDAECRSAALLLGVSILCWSLSHLLSFGVLRCPLKTWTGVPCMTCGGTRALDALLHARAGDAFRLQPLLTLLAMGAGLWIIYALAGAGMRIPRLRVLLSSREKMLLVAVSALLLVANWIYLIADGR